MGLKDTVAKLAQTALTLVGDVRVTAVFRSVTPGQYNPVTDTTADTVRTATVQGILTSRRTDEDDTSRVVDVGTKLIVAALDLPFKPDENDTVLLNGAVWEIVKIKFVPGDPIYTFTIRLP